MDALEVDKSGIRASFAGCQSLGENNSYEIYVEFTKKRLVALSTIRKDDKEYHGIGYADLGDAIVPPAR